MPPSGSSTFTEAPGHSNSYISTDLYLPPSGDRISIGLPVHLSFIFIHHPSMIISLYHIIHTSEWKWMSAVTPSLSRVAVSTTTHQLVQMLICSEKCVLSAGMATVTTATKWSDYRPRLVFHMISPWSRNAWYQSPRGSLFRFHLYNLCLLLKVMMFICPSSSS